MNCDFDLRDYYFNALSDEDSSQVKRHLKECEPCSAELEQLRMTALSLRALPDEELPRRIAFVSDKVFEPSPIARWFQWFWMSGARIGSLAIILLACAIVVHAYRPGQIVRVVQPPPVTAASFDRVAMDAAVHQAVAKAVGEAEARYDLKLQRVIAENEKQKRETMERVATGARFHGSPQPRPHRRQ